MEECDCQMRSLVETNYSPVHGGHQENKPTTSCGDSQAFFQAAGAEAADEPIAQ